jgi:hypothetical protein
MKVNALDRDWEVRDITYSQKRELHAMNAKVWWAGKQDVEAYYKLLGKVEEYSGLGPKDFDGLSMVEIDQVLQAVFIEYLGLSPKD